MNWPPASRHWMCLAVVLVVLLRSQTFCRQKHCAAAEQITVFGINTVLLLILLLRFQCISRISAARMVLIGHAPLYEPKQSFVGAVLWWHDPVFSFQTENKLNCRLQVGTLENLSLSRVLSLSGFSATFSK